MEKAKVVAPGNAMVEPAHVAVVGRIRLMQGVYTDGEVWRWFWTQVAQAALCQHLGRARVERFSTVQL